MNTCTDIIQISIWRIWCILVETVGVNFGLKYGYWDINKWKMKNPWLWNFVHTGICFKIFVDDILCMPSDCDRIQGKSMEQEFCMTRLDWV